MQQLVTNTLPDCAGMGFEAAAASPDRFVCIGMANSMESSAASLWGDAYLNSTCTVEAEGRLMPLDPELRKVHWWRAQAVRFIMRWPSAHLCHVTNQERHRAFGTLAANHVTRFLQTQSEALSSLSHGTAPAASATSAATSAAATSSAPTALNVPANAMPQGGGGENANGNGSDASWSLGVQEPYMPRPIVSLHVRGTDKFAEMGLTSLDAHLFHINRLRHHGLNLSHVWLNTETQANVDRAADQPSWTFFYSSNARQQAAAGSLRQYERD
ncbi:unnamed protein product [Closterium sp. Yama58-4]|nr:unnamed protein product [Closterium sp. Yama58-4]